jgi:hypothetical protein
MSHNDAIEGVGGRPDDGVHPHVQQWQQYQDYQDQQDAKDAQDALDAAGRTQAQDTDALARRGHVAGAGESSPFEQVAARMAEVAAAAAAPALKPEDRDGRTQVLAAMQQKALDRLEAPVQADAVNAAVRTADRLDVASDLEVRDELNTKYTDGLLTDREQQKGEGALATPDDFVRRIEGEERGTAEERREDQQTYKEAGLLRQTPEDAG